MTQAAPAKQLPILDLKRQYAQLKQDMDAAVIGVLESGAFINGPNVKAFEQEAAAYLNTKHGIGVASGTDALYIALRALSVGRGDEVLVPSFTYIASTETIAHVGANPVFIDLDTSGSFNLNIETLEAKITPNTKAIMVVHLYGQAVNMDQVMAIAGKHNLPVIEDCAQAWGAEWNGKKVGTFGAFGCYSFFPSKNLGCYGDGGFMSTNNDELADKARMIKAHGSKKRYYHEVSGVNSRLDEIQAAILRVKLPHIDSWNNERRRVAQRYSENLGQIQGVTVPVITEGSHHVFHQYTIRIDPAVAKRDEVQAALKERGIMTMIYYPLPCHVQGTHAHLGHKMEDLPVTAQYAETVLSLPVFPELTNAEVDQVIEAIQQVLKA